MKYLIKASARRVFLVCSVFLSCTVFGFTEREAVAACLVLEAGGDGVQGMTAVMHVIKNRAKDVNRSAYAVVTAKSQFATMRRGVSWAVLKARPSTAYPQALRIYDKYVAGTLGPDTTYGARYFESFGYKRKPRWTRGLVLTTVVGRNHFYRRR